MCIYVCVFILSSYLNENRETLLLLIMCLHDHSLSSHADKPILFCTCKARLSQSWHCESIHFSHSVMSESLWPHGLQHARLPCPSPTTGACSNSCPSSQWCHPTISSSVFPLSSCLQSFTASYSFSSKSVLCIRCPKYWSVSFSISPSNEYSGLLLLGLTGLISLKFKGLSRVFEHTVQKHQFFGTQLSLWSNSHIHTWVLEKP